MAIFVSLLSCSVCYLHTEFQLFLSAAASSSRIYFARHKVQSMQFSNVKPLSIAIITDGQASDPKVCNAHPQPQQQ
jgi:hypothetical protein